MPYIFLKHWNQGFYIITSALACISLKTAPPGLVASAKHNHQQRPKEKVRNFITKSVIASALAALVATSGAFAGDKTTIVEESAPPKINLLLATQFADKYVTPRGMIVRDEGLTIQPLLLAFLPLYKSDNFSLTFVGGMWNDFGTARVSKNAPYGSDPKTRWTEIDPIVGLSAGLGKYFTLDVTYTAFVEQILDIGTSNHLETKLSFKDSDFLGAFALNPYVIFWYELDGKATSAQVPQAVFGPSAKSGNNPQPGSSWYFDIGITPSYTFKDFGSLTVSLPCRVLLPNERFYGEYYGEASTIGLWEVGVKASAPLTFMPKSYGSWSANVGVKFLYFEDDNLANLNTFNASGEFDRSTTQIYGGVSVFF